MKKTKPELIERAFNFNLRAAENEEHGSIIEGRAIVYDSVTDLGFCKEVIKKGALKETDLTDVRLLVNHDISKIPLARSRNNNDNSTMQLTVDDEGLLIRAVLDIENNVDAKSLYSAVQRGDISGMSFTFSIEDEEWTELNTDMPTRHIKKIASVIECSAVTFPAYEETSINTRSTYKLESLRKTLESARRDYDTKVLESAKNNTKLSKEVRMLNKIYN